MRSKIILFTLSLLLFLGCDQSPTTLDEEPFLEGVEDLELYVEITAFQFDYLAQEFFFSVASVSPEPSLEVTARLEAGSTLMASLVLNDEGIGDDIQINDNSFDGNWILPDSTLFDSLWTLNVQVVSNGLLKSDIESFQPIKPSPPILLEVIRPDSLQLIAGSLVLDTLVIIVSHSQGFDEIRDVSMRTLRPDGSWANDSIPIPLHDDGGSKVIFTYGDTDYYSGDEVVGDGIYSLQFGLLSNQLDGTYYWTFNARSWLGIDAEPIEDSTVVLPVPGSLMKASSQISPMPRVFQ
ncbi:hypothetical protein HQ531_04625 [bacterium]|nr:hypothetical protein [bacterium]